MFGDRGHAVFGKHRMRSMRTVLGNLLTVGLLLGASTGRAQLVPGSMEVHWNAGAADCATNPQPPIQVHAYNAQIFILRENPCATLEAPFMYLLLGSAKALLIDSGDVADARQMPLAQTVTALLPQVGPRKYRCSWCIRTVIWIIAWATRNLRSWRMWRLFRLTLNTSRNSSVFSIGRTAWHGWNSAAEPWT